ncbi:MAG: D-alanyl-D-alanine carboxypeptidase [Patescibacteria group bacterium]|nr:D-alanyl-D-alanine carboxypeptidase [Patescibacteria group bacterium]
MKVFELEYLIGQSLRKTRGRFKKSLQRKEITFTTVLRFLSLAVIFFNIFFTGTAAPSASKSSEGGSVLSQTVTAAPPLEIVKPVRISESQDFTSLLGKAALVEDATSSAVLYEKNADEKLPPASLTKMMTALLTFKNADLSREVAVSPECTDPVNLGASALRIGLKAGQRFTVRSLLYALLLPSAADAACVLSENTMPQATTSAQFVTFMNGEAKTLGLSDTHFGNPSGVDDSNDDNYSTARDLLKLTRTDLAYPEFRRITETPQETITAVGGAQSFSLITTNELLPLNIGFDGIKTGYTDKALGCLAFLYNRDGHEIIGVVLGSSDRFADARNLVDWVFRSYLWQ